jgi:hypothetical protein
MEPLPYSIPLQAPITHQQEWETAFKWAVILTAIMRLLLGGVVALTWNFTRGLITPIIQMIPDLMGNTPVYKNLWFDIFIGAWIRWDAAHYLSIAKLGYSGSSPMLSVFYPLFPTLTRITAQLINNQYELAGLIIATLSLITSLALLYKMVVEEFGPQTALWTTVALCIFPSAFYLVAPYTESLFIALTLAMFYLAPRKQWGWVGLLGACASLTRGPGAYTTLALAWLAWKQYRTGQLNSMQKKIATVTGLALPGLAGLCFILWRSWAGYPPMNDIFTQYFNLRLVNPIQGLWLALSQSVMRPWYSTFLDISSAFIGLVLLAVMLRNPRWRRGEWIIFMALNLGVYLSKYQVFLLSSPLQSLARYALVLFPGFIIAGEWLSRQKKNRQILYLAINGILLLIICMLQTMNFLVE